MQKKKKKIAFLPRAMTKAFSKEFFLKKIKNSFPEGLAIALGKEFF